MPHNRHPLRHLVASLVLAVVAAGDAAAVEPGFEVCAAQFPIAPPLELVITATNAGSVRLDAITAEGYLDAAALEAGSTWDFSGLTGDDRVLQIAPVDSLWSCSVPNCGRMSRADALLVQDNYPGPTRDVNAISYNGSDRILLHAQVSGENEPDELRVCFETDVTFMQFPRAGDCMAEADAAWSTGLSCDEAVTQDNPCGTAGAAAGLNGVIDGIATKNGTLTLPSRHIVDAVLVRTYANFDADALLFGACVATVETLQQYLMMWVVPEYGPLVQLSSPGGDTDLSWQSTGSTTVGYGLLPPVDAWIDSVTDTEIALSWDPGTFPGSYGPDSFYVNWGTIQGNPDLVSATIPATDTTYTVTGLAPGTDYCVSVTAGLTYTDPVAGVATEYRSIELPVTIGADIDGDGARDTSYPVELCVTTTGTVGPIDLLRHDGLKSDLPLTTAAHLYLPSFTPGNLDPDTVVLNDGKLWWYGWATNRPVMLVKNGNQLEVH